MDNEYSKTYSEVRNKAIAHIGIAVSSSGKIRDYLLEAGYPSDVIEDVIEELIEEKYVDDHRYARKVLRTRTGNKAEGRIKLLARLLQAGVPEDVAEDALSDDEFSDENTIMEVIRSRYPADSFSSDPATAKKELAKAVRYLESRGYSTSLALASFRKMIRDVE
ncbi:MAG: RecX family transcriptional regulator [Clostridiales bacterium]|nr:RecX family transcriptional regulator [Clostridiales bacterium]